MNMHTARCFRSLLSKEAKSDLRIAGIFVKNVEPIHHHHHHHHHDLRILLQCRVMGSSE
jgi:hypothetical protein